MYSVTDECSFSECSRLKFLINSFAKRPRKISVSLPDGGTSTTPVILVGNQNDRLHDRTISEEQGLKRSTEIGCAAFYEISVRECPDCVGEIFTKLYNVCKKSKRTSRPSVSRQLSLPSGIPEESEMGVAELNTLTLSRRRKALFTVSWHIFCDRHCYDSKSKTVTEINTLTLSRRHKALFTVSWHICNGHCYDSNQRTESIGILHCAFL